MAVMECDCGMVISLANGHSTARCIRCGSGQLKALDSGLLRSKVAADGAGEGASVEPNRLPIVLVGHALGAGEAAGFAANI